MSNSTFFVSWAMPKSKEISALLIDFAYTVVPEAKIYISSEIPGGKRWISDLSSALESCHAGVAVITSENAHRPWLYFEAGAISKRVDRSRLLPLLCGTDISAIMGTPLEYFQALALNKGSIFQFIKLIEESSKIKSQSQSQNNLICRFNLAWSARGDALLSNIDAIIASDDVTLMERQSRPTEYHGPDQYGPAMRKRIETQNGMSDMSVVVGTGDWAGPWINRITAHWHANGIDPKIRRITIACLDESLIERCVRADMLDSKFASQLSNNMDELKSASHLQAAGIDIIIKRLEIFPYFHGFLFDRCVFKNVWHVDISGKLHARTSLIEYFETQSPKVVNGVRDFFLRLV